MLQQAFSKQAYCNSLAGWVALNDDSVQLEIVLEEDERPARCN
jgi:hypothetical protein